MRYQKARVSISLRHHTMFAFLWGVGGNEKSLATFRCRGFGKGRKKRKSLSDLYLTSDAIL